MRRHAVAATVIFLSSLLAPSARAWFDEGHMAIAYLAFQNLKPATKQAVGELLKLNPDYCKWKWGAVSYGDADPSAAIFMRASTWPDEIKGRADYANDAAKDATPGADPLGYDDKAMHKYWHHRDGIFSTDGSAGLPPDPANVLTQLNAFIPDVNSNSGYSASVRSYELTWIIHLVGDAHQPLHAAARFAKSDKGDGGVNSENVLLTSGIQTKLHFFWDGIFGGYTTTVGTVFDVGDTGLDKVPVDSTKATDLAPEDWLAESLQRAIDLAYAEPVHSSADGGPDVTKLMSEYEINARNAAREQAALAAARLANLLNQQLNVEEAMQDVKCTATTP